MTTKQINVRLPLELHRALARHKELTGEDKSDVIRRGIELALDVGERVPLTAVVVESGDAECRAVDPLEKVRSLISQRS